MATWPGPERGHEVQRQRPDDVIRGIEIDRHARQTPDRPIVGQTPPIVGRERGSDRRSMFGLRAVAGLSFSLFGFLFGHLLPSCATW